MIAISRYNIIVIDYIVNVIIISDFFHDYTRYLIIYHVIPCQRYGLACKAKNNNRTDLPIDGHIYIHMIICQFIGSMNMKGKCFETLFQRLPLL